MIGALIIPNINFADFDVPSENTIVILVMYEICVNTTNRFFCADIANLIVDAKPKHRSNGIANRNTKGIVLLSKMSQ